MVYIRSEDLAPGMCLARDITYFDSSAGNVITIKAGSRLTDMNITQIHKSDAVSGMYIDEKNCEVRIISSINSQIKEHAISDLHNLADNFMDSGKGVTESDIDKIGNTAEQLIDELADKKDILINIADIKMYDDYTFHHCLSVAIMSIAIGIEIGLPRPQLNELGIAGMLHDIGKVSVPIEIINKKGKLTEKEFATVKLHPLYAANHLKERNLVSEHCLAGILEHHEKWDGSGYPYGKKEREIHPYARIMAVADVYDALTSNRPYRVPAPPNEAIEYIMGGMGAHFDEDVIRAFLRKVAPYPVGSKVKLSNGEKGVVIKNDNDHPLRPAVTSENGSLYDLGKDPRYLNIVIMGLDEPSDRRLING